MVGSYSLEKWQTGHYTLYPRYPNSRGRKYVCSDAMPVIKSQLLLVQKYMLSISIWPAATNAAGHDQPPDWSHLALTGAA